jgi:hypothetical protein
VSFYVHYAESIFSSFDFFTIHGFPRVKCLQLSISLNSFPFSVYSKFFLLWHPSKPVVPILVPIFHVGIFLSVFHVQNFTWEGITPYVQDSSLHVSYLKIYGPEVWSHIHAIGEGKRSSRGRIVKENCGGYLVLGTSNLAENVLKPWKWTANDSKAKLQETQHTSSRFLTCFPKNILAFGRGRKKKTKLNDLKLYLFILSSELNKRCGS